jgi:hypothetical protein
VAEFTVEDPGDDGVGACEQRIVGFVRWARLGLGGGGGGVLGHWTVTRCRCAIYSLLCSPSTWVSLPRCEAPSPSSNGRAFFDVGGKGLQLSLWSLSMWAGPPRREGRRECGGRRR